MSLSIPRLNQILDRGDLIAFPTETFYALGADPFNRQALQKIFALKGRAERQPILILIDDPSRLSQFTETISDSAQCLIEQFWPGPLTLLFPASPALPEELTGGSEKIGIRQPGNPFTLDLLRQLDRPLTGTSANRSGKPALKSGEEVERELGEDEVEVIAGPIPEGNQPSTVLDITVSPPSFVREGALRRETIEHFLKSLPE